MLSVSAVRDIDYQDYNIINIYQKSAPAILDGRMTAEDGYGAPLATITLEQFFDNWGIDTDPGYENINSDTDIIPQQVDIYGFYTAENFYYCLVVRDLVHYNNGHENLYSGGDSVFFNMVGDREATDDSSRYRYCMRITNDGVADVFNYSENVSNEITGYEDWKVTRDEPSKITTYEIVVPFDDILEDTTIDVGDWFYFQEGLELSKKGTIVAAELTYQTSVPDIFAGGDVHTGPKFVIDAIAAGREAAISMQRYMRPHSSLTLNRNRRDFIELDKASVVIPIDKIKAPARQAEAYEALTEEQVKLETSRCLSCGASVVDENRCIGCGLCTTRCHFDAIHLSRDVPECSNLVDRNDSMKVMFPYMAKRAAKIAIKDLKAKLGKK